MKKKLFVCLLVSQINQTAANAAQQGFLDAITDAGATIPTLVVLPSRSWRTARGWW
jgi:hypothetical protein